MFGDSLNRKNLYDPDAKQSFAKPNVPGADQSRVPYSNTTPGLREHLSGLPDKPGHVSGPQYGPGIDAAYIRHLQSLPDKQPVDRLPANPQQHQQPQATPLGAAQGNPLLDALGKNVAHLSAHPNYGGSPEYDQLAAGQLQGAVGSYRNALEGHANLAQSQGLQTRANEESAQGQFGRDIITGANPGARAVYLASKGVDPTIASGIESRFPGGNAGSNPVVSERSLPGLLAQPQNQYLQRYFDPATGTGPARSNPGETFSRIFSGTPEAVRNPRSADAQLVRQLFSTATHGTEPPPEDVSGLGLFGRTRAGLNVAANAVTGGIMGNGITDYLKSWEENKRYNEFMRQAAAQQQQALLANDPGY